MSESNYKSYYRKQRHKHHVSNESRFFNARHLQAGFSIVDRPSRPIDNGVGCLKEMKLQHKQHMAGQLLDSPSQV